MNFLDNISFRIKTKNSLQANFQNTNKVNKHIIQDNFFMNFTNSLNEKTLQYAINKYGSVGIYVFNTHNDVDELSNKISDEFFEHSYDKIFLTTDNPLYLKKYINKK